MKTGADFKKALGGADAQFEQRVFQTLDELYEKEHRPVRKIKLGTVLVLGIIVLTVTALAANQLGLMDFFGKWENIPDVPDKAKEMIQIVDEAPLLSKSNALFTVRETLFDGMSGFVTVAIAPPDDKTLLLPLDMYYTDTITVGGKEITVKEYAEQNDMSLMAVNASVAMDCGADYLFEADGTAVIMFQFQLDAPVEELKVELLLNSAVYQKSGEEYSYTMDDIVRETMLLTLHAEAVSGSVQSGGMVEFADCGVTVEKVELQSSDLNTYAKIYFFVSDEALYQKTRNALWFEFVDADGNRLSSGFGLAGSGIMDMGGGHYVQSETLTRYDSLPDTVRLRAYTSDDKTRYETHEVSVN